LAALKTIGDYAIETNGFIDAVEIVVTGASATTGAAISITAGAGAKVSAVAVAVAVEAVEAVLAVIAEVRLAEVIGLAVVSTVSWWTIGLTWILIGLGGAVGAAVDGYAVEDAADAPLEVLACETAAAISLVIGFSAGVSATGSGNVDAAKLYEVRGAAAFANGSVAKEAAGVATTVSGSILGGGITTFTRFFFFDFLANSLAWSELTPDVEASSDGVETAAVSATDAAAGSGADAAWVAVTS
jgi:hypothetical protein